MKKNDYLIVHKSILPDYFDNVIAARELINDKNISVSEACKIENISRSTYYKYKDLIFRPKKDSGNKVVFSIKTIDEKGVLLSIIKIITENNGNVISINQDSPLDSGAFITLAIDISELDISIEELKIKMSTVRGLKSIDIMGVE